MTGVAGGAADVGGAWAELEKASVGAHWALARAVGETEVQAGAGAWEGGEVRALGPRREAGRRVSEAWGEPLSVGEGWRMPGPGLDCWSRCDVETGAGLQTGPGGVRGFEGSWELETGRPCSSPGSSPDCALGLTP